MTRSKVVVVGVLSFEAEHDLELETLVVDTQGLRGEPHHSGPGAFSHPFSALVVTAVLAAALAGVVQDIRGRGWYRTIVEPSVPVLILYLIIASLTAGGLWRISEL